MSPRRLLAATLVALTAVASVASTASANTGATRWNTMCGSSSGTVSLYRTSTGAVHTEAHLECPSAGASLHFVVKRDGAIIYSADLPPQTIPIPATNLFDSYWWKEFGTCWHGSGYQVVATYTWYGTTQTITSLTPSVLC